MNDPAFLFYSSDFLTGTMLFTDEQVGKYIRTLCYIHQHGHISCDELNMLCKEDKIVMNKFILDENNRYFNNRLEKEIEKRRLYSESRRNNRLRRTSNDICETYDEHMENENIIVNDNDNTNDNNKDSKVIKSDEWNIEIYKRIINHLNYKIGSNFRYNSKGNKKHITARLNEGYTEGDFYVVIDKKVNDWFDDEKMKEYLVPETLFGNKFDKYLNAPSKTKTLKGVGVDITSML